MSCLLSSLFSHFTFTVFAPLRKPLLAFFFFFLFKPVTFKHLNFLLISLVIRTLSPFSFCFHFLCYRIVFILSVFILLFPFPASTHVSPPIPMSQSHQRYVQCSMSVLHTLYYNSSQRNTNHISCRDSIIYF